MTVEEASEISGIDSANIFFLQNLDSFLANRILLDSRHALVRKPNNLYLDLFREYLMEKPSVLNRFDKLIKTYPELKILDACEILDGLRRIKSESEIKHMSQAIEYTRLGIEAMMKTVKPNMNERQLESLFEYTIKQNGSFGTSFNTIVASGKNATVLHYEDNNSNISEGSLVLTDLGALSSEYAGDITRTYPVNGVFTKRQREYYELVLSVNKAIIDMIKPGVTFKDLNVKAYDLLAEGMIKLGKIKEKSELTKYYYHSIGHYLGLDVHDVGSNILPFEPGVVLTVEPGIYIEEEGIGVRIEDNILVTDKGHKNLSEKIIKEVKDIEEFMKK
jgi:Xaa-Pro aminopeptidase